MAEGKLVGRKHFGQRERDQGSQRVSGLHCGIPERRRPRNVEPLSTCRHFVAMLGDKPRDEARQDGTTVTVFRYEAGTAMTRWNRLVQAVAIF